MWNFFSSLSSLPSSPRTVWSPSTWPRRNGTSSESWRQRHQDSLWQRWDTSTYFLQFCLRKLWHVERQGWLVFTWVRLPKLRFIFEPWESPKNTETLCDMGGTFSYSLSPHISQASLQYKSAMTWAFHFSAMFSSVIKAKNLQLYKKLQNLLSLFQKLKSWLISALQTHMSLRPLKCYLLSIFWVLPLWNPLRIKEAILMCAKTICARKVWCPKKINLRDLFIGEK